MEAGKYIRGKGRLHIKSEENTYILPKGGTAYVSNAQGGAGNLNVSGATTLSNTLNVSGITTLGNELNINGQYVRIGKDPNKWTIHVPKRNHERNMYFAPMDGNTSHFGRSVVASRHGAVGFMGGIWKAGVCPHSNGRDHHFALQFDTTNSRAVFDSAGGGVHKFTHSDSWRMPWQ